MSLYLCRKSKKIKFMKKVLIIALGLIMIAPFIYETSVSAEQVLSNSTANKPHYWQGWVNNSGIALYITVYQDNNQCYSYYAIATKQKRPSIGTIDISPTELIVKQTNSNYKRYYVTYDGMNYYFNM